jgi:hypothetical protein
VRRRSTYEEEHGDERKEVHGDERTQEHRDERKEEHRAERKEESGAAMVVVRVRVEAVVDMWVEVKLLVYVLYV